jgi:predicted RNA binding protein YcfA (HicA-like mRNA interferase family)
LTRLPVISGKKVVKVLERNGFVIFRQRGSHIRMKKVTPELTIKLTIPLHGTLDRGTLKSIIKSSGLTTEEFVELL